MDTSKLIAFAQAVGVDIKELKQLLNGKIDNATVTQLIEQAKMSGSTEGAVVQKLADLGRRIDEFANLDLVATYNAAKA
jgi:hypothetical protein